MDDYVAYLSEFSPWYLVLLALLLFLWVFPLWRIIGKAGYPPFLSLFAIFPVVGLLLLWWLAFAQWPIRCDAPIRRDAPVPARSETSW